MYVTKPIGCTHNIIDNGKLILYLAKLAVVDIYLNTFTIPFLLLLYQVVINMTV